MKQDHYLNFYGDYSETNLPKTYRVYFDPYCEEYKHYPVENKLLDLAYVITHGFDIKKAIKNILDSHPHVSQRHIQRAVWQLISAVNHSGTVWDSTNSLETVAEIFIEYLLRYYRLPLDNSIPHYLEKNFRYVREISLYAANGWEIASKNVNENQMYKDDNFMFYLGDEELLFR